MRKPFTLFVATFAGLLTTPLIAQVSPSLVIEPWGEDPHWAQTIDELIFINGGHDKRAEGDIDIFYWDSQGRVKFDKADPDPAFTLGYRVLTMDVGASDTPAINGELNDLAIAAALRLGGDDAADEAWEWTLTAGVGTANDGHFSNGDAVYGIGGINAAHTIDPDSSLNIGVSYHGNRTFLPDVPLPYAVYRHRVDEKLAYSVGVPTSGIVWRPVEPLVLRAEYTVPFNLAGSAEYSFSENVGVFAEYRRTLDAFYIDDRENTRLFYDFSRVSTGVHLTWQPLIDARIGIGYAFDQDFSTGFDVRGLDTVAEPSDEVLFFFTLQGTF